MLLRKSVNYLDNCSICAKGETIDVTFILRRGRNAAPQEEDDGAISFWPWRMANAAKVSASLSYSY